MIFRCYNGRLPAHALPLFGHVILPVRRYVVQHILQTVELVMVEYTDSVYGYLLRGNPAVGNVGFAHRAAAVLRASEGDSGRGPRGGRDVARGRRLRRPHRPGDGHEGVQAVAVPVAPPLRALRQPEKLLQHHAPPQGIRGLADLQADAPREPHDRLQALQQARR